MGDHHQDTRYREASGKQSSARCHHQPSPKLFRTQYNIEDEVARGTYTSAHRPSACHLITLSSAIFPKSLQPNDGISQIRSHSLPIPTPVPCCNPKPALSTSMIVGMLIKYSTSYLHFRHRLSTPSLTHKTPSHLDHTTDTDPHTSSRSSILTFTETQTCQPRQLLISCSLPALFANLFYDLDDEDTIGTH